MTIGGQSPYRPSWVPSAARQLGPTPAAGTYRTASGPEMLRALKTDVVILAVLLVVWFGGFLMPDLLPAPWSWLFMLGNVLFTCAVMLVEAVMTLFNRRTGRTWGMRMGGLAMVKVSNGKPVGSDWSVGRQAFGTLRLLLHVLRRRNADGPVLGSLVIRLPAGDELPQRPLPHLTQ